QALYETALANYKSNRKEYMVIRERYATISAWVRKTVDARIMNATLLELEHQGRHDLRAMIRILKNDLAPSHTGTLTQAQKRYREMLAKARMPSTSPLVWTLEFTQAFRDAKAHRLPDVEGLLAIKAFLEAVGARFSPAWASTQLQSAVQADQLG
ncbi:hypothetical protein M434DRAFT_55362, partial [Hypoxylon sp. CO27-5]